MAAATVSRSAASTVRSASVASSELIAPNGALDEFVKGRIAEQRPPTRLGFGGSEVICLRPAERRGHRRRRMLAVRTDRAAREDGAQKRDKDELFHQRLRLPGADAGRGVTVDVGGRKGVVPDDPVRTGDVIHPDHRRQRHELAVAVAHFEVLQRGFIGPVIRVRLHEHAIDAAEEIDVVHVKRAEVRLQRRVDIRASTSRTFNCAKFTR